MRIGFMTNILVKHGMKTLPEVAAWGIENGYEDLEVGPTLPLDEADYKKVIDEGKIKITALTYCRNFLSTDKAEAKEHLDGLKTRIQFAGRMNIEKIVTSTGIDKTLEEGVYDKADSIRKTPARSLALIEETFTPIVKMAEECGVKICFENCPLMGNTAISPVMWNEIFARLNSPNVGLAYDPSHLIWQFIDPYAAIEEFAPRIFHVHAKDTVIDRKKLARSGILTDFSWWKYRIPGTGEINWEKLIGLLKQNGYTGTISLEHEDPDYEENLANVQKGLVLAKQHLQQYI